MKEPFIKVNPEFVLTNDLNIITNFWELNPALAIISPFNVLYNQDKSKDRVDSSKTMWCIFFNNEPDETINIYFRIPSEEREAMLKEVFHKDLNFEELRSYEEAFRKICLTSIQKDLLLEKEALHERAIFLRDTKYSLDEYETVTVGNRVQRITLPGTAKQLDAMKKATESIMKNFERIEEKYFESKRNDNRVFGGRVQSASEKKLI